MCAENVFPLVYCIEFLMRFVGDSSVTSFTIIFPKAATKIKKPSFELCLNIEWFRLRYYFPIRQKYSAFTNNFLLKRMLNHRRIIVNVQFKSYFYQIHLEKESRKFDFAHNYFIATGNN